MAEQERARQNRQDKTVPVPGAARSVSQSVFRPTAFKRGGALQRRRAIAAAGELSQKAAALRLDVGRRRADAARRKVADELAQLEEDETAASARALDFYEKLARPGRYEPIAFESDTVKPAAEEAIVCYALAALTVDASKLPKGVDASRRERHLSPDAFRAAFGVGATAFSAWPKWRQALAKRKVGLY